MRQIASLFILYLLFSPFVYASIADPSIDSLLLWHTLKQSNDVASTSQSTTLSPKPLRLLIDVRSNHSDGEHDLLELIDLAQQRYIDVLAFNEHDRFTIRLGLEPIPWLIGYSQEHPSLYQTGLATFFTNLQAAQQQTSLSLIAGTESTPGYSWSGIPFKDLSLHHAERHIITLGATQAAHIQALPSYTLKHAHGHQALSLVFWFVFIFVLILILLRKRKISVALLLAGSFIAFMSTWLMQPHAQMDEDFIHAAKEQGLFTIWAHPGTRSGVRDGPMGVKLNTPPYNQHIFDYPADAFAAVYGDTDQNTVAGGLWDRYMMQYMQGLVGRPMWAVAAGDFHSEGQANEYLGNFPMDIWAKSTSPTDILEALKHGRMTAWHMGKAHHIAVSELYLTYIDPDTKHVKTMLTGDEASISPQIKLAIGLHELGQSTQPTSLQGHWIINGQIHSQVTLRIHERTTSITSLTLPKGKHVIRFQIPYQHGIRLETNPFLVDVRTKE